jgi:NAD(P)-dependent dehydrogenase (short-subunit alcohol dehydrogenase family)
VNRRSPFDLTGEVAVVLGGTGGLGGAMGVGLAQAGAKVAILGRNKERGEAKAKEISKAGQAIFISADALDAKSLEQAELKIEKELGPVTVLVNAAGGNQPAAVVTSENPMTQLPLAAWKENFDLNLVGGALLPCQIFGVGMLKRKKGSIINIASVSAHIPLSKVVAYSAAKAAVISLTQFLAREWAPHGVRVNSITPGFFPAEQNRKLLFKDDGSPTDRAKAILGHTPMGRFGDPAELIGAAVFLASPKASAFVTGIDLRVDGGFLSQTI